MKLFRSFLLVLALLCSAALTPTARAATFNIPNGDTAALIGAIATSNTNGEADVINLASTGTYTLTTNIANEGLPRINADNGSSLTINGNGAVIERSLAAGTPEFRLIVNLGTLVLNALTLRNGFFGTDFDYGAGSYNSGDLTMTSCTLSNNFSPFGGAIFNLSTMNLQGCIISNNGAISASAFCNAGAATVSHCTISGNVGLEATPNNSATGAVFNYSKLNISNCTISGNSTPGTGGGLHVTHFDTYTHIDRSTITGNSSAPGQGGGIFDDSAPGVWVTNSILTSNTGSDFANVDNPGYTIVNGHNIIGTYTDPNVFTDPSNILGVTDPGLNPLADNGGPTWTHSLKDGSPALDAGDPDYVTSPTDYDQRGEGFARVSGTHLDIGAFERQVNVAPTLSDITLSVTRNTTYTFAPDSFDAGFNDNPGDILANVVLYDPLPSHGTLKYRGVPVHTAQNIERADLASLTFEPAAGFMGGDSFTWTASDGELNATQERKVFLNVSEAPSLVVTTSQDVLDEGDGLTSLREAILLANSNPDSSDITFNIPGTGPFTILLNEALPAIGTDSTIAGPTAANKAITVSGQDAVTPFFMLRGSAAISNLTITHGKGQNGQVTRGEAGGLELQGGTLVLSNCTFSHNRGGDGGIIFTPSSGGDGGPGGFYAVAGASLRLNQCTLSDNQGGKGGNGPRHRLGDFFGANGGNGGPGAGGTANLLTAVQCTVVGNTGGTGGNGSAGLFYAGNAGVGGAGGFRGGLLTLGQDIIAQNTPGTDGQPGGGQVVVIGQEQPNLNLPPIAAPTSGDLFGQVTSLGYNVIGQPATNDSVMHDFAVTDLTGANALPLVLGPLADNGGPTQTMAVLSGVAVNGGDPNYATNGTDYDQRGAGFPRVLGGRIDIGALEGQAAAPTTFGISGTIKNSAGTSINGVLVTLKEVLPNGSFGDVFRQTGNGSYAFTGLAAGKTYLVRLDRDSNSFAPNKATILLDANKTLDFVAGFAVSGQVKRNDNTPLSGIKMERRPQSGPVVTATTDAGGIFLFDATDAGSYTIAPAASEAAKYGFAPATRPANVSTSDIGNLNFTATPSAFTVGGSIRNSANAPVPGIIVTATNSTTNALAGSAVTNAAGQYVVPALPAGNYVLTPDSTHGVAFAPATRAVLNLNANRAGMDFTAIFNVSGKVLDTRGNPVSGVPVTLAGSLATLGTGITVNTNSKGLFLFESVAPGDYCAAPRAKTGSPAGTFFVQGYRLITVSPESHVLNFTQIDTPDTLAPALTLSLSTQTVGNTVTRAASGTASDTGSLVRFVLLSLSRQSGAIQLYYNWNTSLFSGNGTFKTETDGLLADLTPANATAFNYSGALPGSLTAGHYTLTARAYDNVLNITTKTVDFDVTPPPNTARFNPASIKDFSLKRF